MDEQLEQQEISESTASPPPPPPPASPEEERRAYEMGWRPRDQFKGDPKIWVDAATYIKRGEEVLPIIQARNRQMEGDLAMTKQQLAETNRRLTEAMASMESLKEYQAEATKAAVARAKAELRAKIREARATGDIDAELEAQDKLDELRTPAPAPKAPAPPPPPAGPPVDPALLEWAKDNPWWGQDKRRTLYARAVAEDLRSDPTNDKLQGRAFYDRVAAEVADHFGDKPASKVDGGRPSGASPAPSPSKKGKTFDDLDEEARQACNKQEAKLVGPGKPFKDQASWRAHFVRHYIPE